VSDSKSEEEISASIENILNYVDDTYGEKRDYQKMQEIMTDPSCVFHKTKMVFDEYPLQESEFANMHQVDKNPSKGFVLYMHPFFRTNELALPLLMAYHFVIVNYGINVNASHAEQLGAGLNKIDLESYYQKLCSLSDSIPVTK
jgi:hypothetical protein